MATLNELITNSSNTINKIIENGGELTPELSAEMETLETALETKVDNYALFMDRLKNEITYFKSKSKEFTTVEKTLKNLDANLKDRIKYAMGEMKKTELRGDNYRFKLSDTAGKLVISDEKLIPDKYKTETVIVEIDNETMKNDLRNGIDIAGAYLEKTKSLRKYISKSK